MKTKSIATIISLSPRTLSVVESAVSLLKAAPQQYFVFEVGGQEDLLPASERETPRPWSDLEAALVAERHRRRSEFLVGVLDEPIEDNWFSHTAYGKGVAWITVNDWEFYSNLPVVSFVAYDVVLNTVLQQLVLKPEDEAWLLGEVLHTDETRECISDMCVYKPDISRKILSGKICPDCSRILESRLGTGVKDAVSALLQTVRQTAKPLAPSASTAYFPVFLRMRKMTRRVVNQVHTRMGFLRNRLEESKRRRMEMESKLQHLKQEEEAANEGLAEFKAKLQALEKSVDEEPEVRGRDAVDFQHPGLAEKVEGRYPFPIAYCFRSMRAELNPTERWDTLYELYVLIVRYLVFTMLSSLHREQKAYPEALRTLIQKLKFGFAGDWGRACMALLKYCYENSMGCFLEEFLVTINPEKLENFEAASKALVKSRNSVEHGFKGDKQGFQTLLDRHLPDIKNMLQFTEPLSEYVLIRPVQIIENLDGQCVYFSKVMVGSDPQFIPRQMVSSCVPETVCQLLSPRGNTISLHPWLHLNRCDSCLREMVFLYDAIHIKDGFESVVLREYPSNHEQRQTTLVSGVKRMLSI